MSAVGRVDRVSPGHHVLAGILDQSREWYRKLRNTARFLLGT